MQRVTFSGLSKALRRRSINVLNRLQDIVKPEQAPGSFSVKVYLNIMVESYLFPRASASGSGCDRDHNRPGVGGVRAQADRGPTLQRASHGDAEQHPLCNDKDLRHDVECKKHSMVHCADDSHAKETNGVLVSFVQSDGERVGLQ